MPHDSLNLHQPYLCLHSLDSNVFDICNFGKVSEQFLSCANIILCSKLWRLFIYFKLIVIPSFSVIITSLVIAAKYYQEATEVVVNCDIARILHI